MTTTAAALIILAVLAFSLPAAYWQIRRAAGEESTRDRIIREAHERAEAARVLDPIALAQTGPAERDLDAGCDRLLQAIREHREDEGA